MEEFFGFCTARLKVAFALIVALAILPLASCSELEAKKSPKPPEPVNVRLLQIEPQTISESYLASGVLEGSQEALVTSAITGEIKKLVVTEGDHVRAGDLMAVIDSSDYKLALSKASAVEEEKRKMLERIENLFDSKAVSYSDLDSAVASYKLAAIALEEARLNLSRTKITTPIGGQVTVKEKILGDRVSAGSPIFKVVNTKKLKLTIALSEKEIVNLKKTDDAEFFVDSFPGRSFIGKILYIRISPTKGVASFPVDIELENPGGLKPGMIARVKLKGKTFKNLLLVPAEAIVERMGLYYLFIYEEGHAFLRPIKQGRRFGGLSEITKGLNAGDRIIPIHASRLTDGMPVNVIKEEAETPQPG